MFLFCFGGWGMGMQYSPPPPPPSIFLIYFSGLVFNRLKLDITYFFHIEWQVVSMRSAQVVLLSPTQSYEPHIELTFILGENDLVRDDSFETMVQPLFHYIVYDVKKKEDTCTLFLQYTMFTLQFYVV